jgi:hypothetical protein
VLIVANWMVDTLPETSASFVSVTGPDELSNVGQIITELKNVIRRPLDIGAPDQVEDGFQIIECSFDVVPESRSNILGGERRDANDPAERCFFHHQLLQRLARERLFSQ